MRKRRTRLVDVANAAQVSISTVSRALRGDRRISAETRQRVIEHAERLGYPLESPPTGSDPTPPQRRVMVLVPTYGVDAFYGATAIEIGQVGRKLGFAVDVASVPSDQNVIDHLTHASRSYDGVVVCTWQNLTETQVQSIEELEVPVVLINRHTEGRTYAVTHDDFAAGMQAASYLIDLGHRHIAHLMGPSESPSVRERTAGFRTALEMAGLYDPDLFVSPVQGNHVEWAISATRYLFARRPAPTAIWTFNDGVASNVLMAARTEGLRVPEDLSIMGFDNLPHSEAIGLTTFEFRSRELGKEAAYLLKRIFTGEVCTPVRVCVAPQLVVRETTGPWNG